MYRSRRSFWGAGKKLVNARTTINTLCDDIEDVIDETNKEYERGMNGKGNKGGFERLLGR